MFGSFSCTASYDNETIAMIGRQKISKVLFHKQIPEVRFNALSDSLKVERVEDFLKDLLIRRDIQKLGIENNSEIVKDLNWVAPFSVKAGLNKTCKWYKSIK